MSWRRSGFGTGRFSPSRATKLLDSHLQLAPRPGRKLKPVDVRAREIGQNLERDGVIAEHVGVLLEADRILSQSCIPVTLPPLMPETSKETLYSFLKGNWQYTCGSRRRLGHSYITIRSSDARTADGSVQEGLRPPVINIGPAAGEIWREFFIRTELRCGKGEIYHDLAGFADKAGEQACRIAAIFAVLSDPSAGDYRR